MFCSYDGQSCDIRCHQKSLKTVMNVQVIVLRPMVRGEAGNVGKINSLADTSKCGHLLPCGQSHAEREDLEDPCIFSCTA